MSGDQTAASALSVPGSLDVAVESEAGDHYLLFVADNGAREYTVQRTKAAPRAEFGRTTR
jgi:hypothetical protein